jgi:phosphomannomutase
LKFGTSGLRGLVVDLEGEMARRYAAAFLDHLRDIGNAGSAMVFLGRDLRPSSLAIQRDCAAAVIASGMVPIDCGALPTPALALHAMANNAAAIMVTGSHIPADRNGLKFYRPDGEISKADELGIAGALSNAPVPLVESTMRFDNGQAIDQYLGRCLALLPDQALSGMRIGVYQHSGVARDLLVQVLRGAGAVVVPLGRVDDFVAVDTEAFGDAVFAPVPNWIKTERLDALVSADGDGDRPLVVDETGAFVRGDALGLFAARLLAADAIVTPVTSNSGIEQLDGFGRVVRTRVGSPHVIEGIQQALAAGARRVVGFEANGGTLLGADVAHGGGSLAALPTRDALLPILATLHLARQANQTVSQLVGALRLRHAVAGRLEDVEQERSAAFLSWLTDETAARDFLAPAGEIVRIARVDGTQFMFANGDMIHFRPSGNAPELRCYVESIDSGRAYELLEWSLGSTRRRILPASR